MTDAFADIPTENVDSVAIERLLVPLDGREQSELLLRYLLPVAKRVQAELTLIHVLLPTDKPTRSPDEISYPDTIHDRAVTLAGDYLSEVSKNIIASTLQVKTIVTAGETAEMVISHVEQSQPGMVALAVQNKSIIQLLILY